jgi:hypothetical protein
MASGCAAPARRVDATASGSKSGRPRAIDVLCNGIIDLLDVGRGAGAITADIAKAVPPDGMALSIDRDEAWCCS